MEIMSSFDRMVLGISQEERMELYERLSASINAEDQKIEEVPVPKEFSNEIDISVQLKKETPFFRFVLLIRSIFSGMDTTHLYNTLVMQRLAKYVEKKYPTLLNYKRGMLKSGFYDRVRALKAVANFFMPGIDLYEDDPGRFYVFLSSLILPEIYTHIEKEIDPFLLPEDKSPTPDVRAAQLRKMDELFQEISGDGRANLYTAVVNIDWLRQFVRLPFDKLLARFLPIAAGDYMCQIDIASAELSQFARVLCNGKTISTDVLQALCLFSLQTQLSNPELDVSALSAEYVNKSMEQISIIKRFLLNVPIRSIAALSFKSSTWMPAQPEGAEDWFVKYKGEWRKLFDKQWENWVKERSKITVENKIMQMLKSDEIPLLPYRPWLDMWGNIKFTRNLAMGFLYAFFKKKFPELNKLFKILLMDGDFKIRDNKIEFSEAFEQMQHFATDVEVYACKFAPNGDVGQIFSDIIEKNDRTVKAHSRIESAITSITAEAGILSVRFNGICSHIGNVLTGIVSDSKNGGYDSLNNIAAIEGRQNQQYRQKLSDARDVLADALECLKELELLEN